MYRVVSRLLITLVCLGLFTGTNVQAAWNNLGKTLVTINGRDYTNQDYLDWWKFWREPGMKFFDSPQEFIDFRLMAEQGRQMEYDQSPAYKRSVHVFLKVRALAALKNEETDAKVKVSEEQIRTYFEENYLPSWSVQILSYDKEEKALEAFKKMQDFNGQKSGRLVFADLVGVTPEDGGPASYDEVEVDPSKIKNAANSKKWLQVISGLKVDFVSEPFLLEESGHYGLVRLKAVSTSNEEYFKELHPSIKKELVKREAARLTQDLLARLRVKYNVRVDEALLESLSLQSENSEEILAKPVVEMDGASLTAGVLMYNVKDQHEIRPNLSEDEMKRMIVNNFIANNLTDIEALSRHYEEKQPIKAIYEFYKDNTLRNVLNDGIKKRIVVTDAEVVDYYNKNRAAYTKPAKVVYVVIEENITLLNEMSRAILQGDSFFDQAQKHSFDVKIKTADAGSLVPELAEQLAGLHKGETGPPFSYHSGHAMVYLVDRVEPEMASLDQVKEAIRRGLFNEKYIKARDAYLEKARSVAEVKVNQRVWNKLKKEYGNAKDL